MSLERLIQRTLEKAGAQAPMRMSLSRTGRAKVVLLALLNSPAAKRKRMDSSDFDESKVKRDHGKFAKKNVAGEGGGDGGKSPKVSSAEHAKAAMQSEGFAKLDGVLQGEVEFAAAGNGLDDLNTLLAEDDEEGEALRKLFSEVGEPGASDDAPEAAQASQPSDWAKKLFQPGDKTRTHTAPDQELTAMDEAIDDLSFSKDRAIGDAVKRYTGWDYIAVNQELWNGKVSEKNQETVDGLNQAIDKFGQLKNPRMVMRGISFSGAEKNDYIGMLEQCLKTGATIENPGFQSTTLDPSVAYDFASESDDPEKTAIEIATKEGLYVDESSSTGGESELILRSGARFKVVGKERNIDYNGRGVIDTVYQLEMVYD